LSKLSVFEKLDIDNETGFLSICSGTHTIQGTDQHNSPVIRNSAPAISRMRHIAGAFLLLKWENSKPPQRHRLFCQYFSTELAAAQVIYTDENSRVWTTWCSLMSIISISKCHIIRQLPIPTSIGGRWRLLKETGSQPSSSVDEVVFDSCVNDVTEEGFRSTSSDRCRLQEVGPRLFRSPNDVLSISSTEDDESIVVGSGSNGSAGAVSTSAGDVLTTDMWTCKIILNSLQTCESARYYWTQFRHVSLKYIIELATDMWTCKILLKSLQTCEPARYNGTHYIHVNCMQDIMEQTREPARYCWTQHRHVNLQDIIELTTDMWTCNILSPLAYLPHIHDTTQRSLR